MDALDRVEPVARDLLARVDATLVRHGAPPDHPIWTDLRRLGTVPGDAVAFFHRTDGTDLRSAAARLRNQAEQYTVAAIPPDVHWHSTAGESYSAHASALAAHLSSEAAPGAGSGTGAGAGADESTMAGRLRATADYAEAVADWFCRSRDGMAMALADVLASAEALTMRSPAHPESTVAAGVVTAAADIGAHVLSAAAMARAAGHDLLYDSQGRLDLLVYRAPALSQRYRFDTTIDLSR